MRVSFARDGIVLPPDTTDATIDAMGSRTCTLAGPVMDAHNASAVVTAVKETFTNLTDAQVKNFILDLFGAYCPTLPTSP